MMKYVCDICKTEVAASGDLDAWLETTEPDEDEVSIRFWEILGSLDGNKCRHYCSLECALQQLREWYNEHFEVKTAANA